MENMKKKTVFVALIIFALAFSFGCQEKDSARGPAPDIKPIGAEAEAKFLKELIKKDPKNLNALVKLGNLSMDSGKYYEAIDAYTQALQINPDLVDARVDMGTCYRYAGMPDKAVIEYRQALKINPRHAFGYKNLGVVLAYDLRRPGEAASVFEQYLKINPTDPDAQKIRDEIKKLRGN